MKAIAEACKVLCDKEGNNGKVNKQLVGENQEKLLKNFRVGVKDPVPNVRLVTVQLLKACVYDKLFPSQTVKNLIGIYFTYSC